MLRVVEAPFVELGGAGKLVKVGGRVNCGDGKWWCCQEFGVGASLPNRRSRGAAGV